MSVRVKVATLRQLVESGLLKLQDNSLVRVETLDTVTLTYSLKAVVARAVDRWTVDTVATSVVGWLMVV